MIEEPKKIKSIIKTEKNSGRLNSVEIVRDIFNAFALHRMPCTANNLIEMTGFPRSTIYKFLDKLTHINFIEKIDDKHYFIGSKIAIYADLYNEDNPRLRLLKDAAHQLSEKIGCTTQLCGRLLGKHIVVYESVPKSENAVRSEMLGRKFPISWTATGRLLLDTTTRKSLLRNLRKSDLTLPDNSPLNLDVLLEEICVAKEHNFYQLESFFGITTSMATRIRMDVGQDYTLNVELFSNASPELFEVAKKEMLSYSVKIQERINIRK